MTAATPAIEMARTYIEANEEENADPQEFIGKGLSLKTIRENLRQEWLGGFQFSYPWYSMPDGLVDLVVDWSDCDYTIKDAARCLGIGESTLRSWEGHNTLPTGNISLFIRIMCLYGMSLEDIADTYLIGEETAIATLLSNRKRKMETGEIKGDTPRAVRLLEEQAD